MSTPRPDVASGVPTKRPIPSDPREIEKEIAVRQARLAATVDELTTRLSPKDIARRSTASARARADEALYAEDGSLRTERIAAVAAAVLALIGWRLWRRGK